ncbi:MAG: hypothetical protein DHS20C12_19050 [Pseudohongiella sp.]|nr:MAG: hypothetical protein DHS20C12_19050 [Pseudohongiella sp.]
MAEISIDVDRKNDITIIAIKGTLEKEDLPNTLSEYFANEPTMNTIYDSTEGDWSNNPSKYYMDMIRSSKVYARKGARTAMVFSNPVDFGIGRMVESHCELEGYENELACFHSLQDAKHWLSPPTS